MQELNDLSLTQEIGINLFEYQDYRHLLENYIGECMKRNRKYSRRYFSTRVGFSDSTTLQKILNRKRHLPEEAMFGFAQVMKLSIDESTYFECLVRRDVLDEGSALYQSYTQKMEALKSRQVDFKTIKDFQKDCASSWLHMIIFEMMALQGASLNFTWIKKSFSKVVDVSTMEVLEAIDDLKQAGLLEENSSGEVTQVEDNLLIHDPKNPKILREVQRRIQKETLAYSIEALKLPVREREIASFIVSTTPEKFKKVKKKMQQHLKEYFEMLDTGPEEGEMVVSFSNVLFPAAYGKSE